MTIVDWCNFCRDICAQWLAHNGNVTEIGGLHDDGTPIVVEIVESYFFTGNITGGNTDAATGYSVAWRERAANASSLRWLTEDGRLWRISFIR